jgi:AcrR family transcriptional regulator
MSKNEEETRERIILAALALFSEKGIRPTSVNAVAYRAGVTRVTVYRYFAEKSELARAVFLYVEQLFERGRAELERNPQADWEDVLAQIGEGLAALPRGDAYARLDELKRLYPDVYRTVQAARVANLNGLFEHLFAKSRRRSLRPGLNRALVQAVFSELVVNFFDNPRFQSLGLSDAELYRAMTDLLLHGVLEDQR